MTNGFELCKSHEAVVVRMEERENASKIKFEALYSAIRMAKEEMDRRLEGMNEFRSQLTKQATEFVGKKEVDLMLEKIEVKLGHLEAMANQRAGGKQWSDHILQVLIGIAQIVALAWIMKS
jgi:hypothetical protein